MHKNNFKEGRQNNVKIHVTSFEPIGKGRFQVKIVENNMNITTMERDGKKYKTIKKLGRGRYIVRQDGETAPETEVVE